MEINMRTRYEKMSDKQLRVLFSKKYVRLSALVQGRGWWNDREMESLENCMKQIEAELNYRKDRKVLL